MHQYELGMHKLVHNIAKLLACKPVDKPAEMFKIVNVSMHCLSTSRELWWACMQAEMHVNPIGSGYLDLRANDIIKFCYGNFSVLYTYASKMCK